MCVVFGGTGFIGSHLVRELSREYDVRVISRRKRVSENGHICYFKANLAEVTKLAKCVEGAAIVFHLATGEGTTWKDYERDYIISTRVIADSCVDKGVSRLVYVSSISALFLGQSRELTEADGIETYPEKRNLYSRAKILAELSLRQIERNRALRLVIVRPGVVVGGGGRLAHGGLGHWPSDIHCLGWGNGQQPVPFVLVRDVVAALVRCGSVPNIDGASFNLAGDYRPNARVFVHRLAVLTNRHFRFHRRSPFAIYVNSMAKFLLKCASGRAGVTPSYRDILSRSYLSRIDCTAAKALLSWAPVSDGDVFFSDVVRALSAGQ